MPYNKFEVAYSGFGTTTDSRRKDPSFGREFANAIPRGLGQTVQGVGQIAEDLGWEANPIKAYGERVIQRNPTEINSLEDIADYPLAALGSATGNAAGFLATGGALGLAGKGLALAGAARAGGIVAGGVGQTANMALPSYGGIREQQLEGGNDSPVDMLAAAGGALTSGYIEQRFGLNKMFGLSSAPKTALRAEVGSMASTPLRTGLKEWGKAGVVEGLEELAQNPIEQIAAYKDPTTGENIQETLFGGAMGVLGGLGLGGYGGVRRGMRQANLRNELQQDMFIAPDAGTPTDLLQGMDRREQYNQVQGAWQTQKDFDRPAPAQQPDEETAAYLEQLQQTAQTDAAKQTLRDNLVSKGVDPAKIEGIVLAAFQPKRTKAAATYTEEQQAIYESLPDTMTDKQKRRIVGKPGVVSVPSVSKVGKIEAKVMKEFDDYIAAGLITPNEESTLRGYWDASEKKQGDAWKLRANIGALIKAKQGAKNGDGSQSVLSGGTPTNQAKNVVSGQAPSGGAQTAQAVSGAQGQEVNDDPARALGLKLLADMPVGKKNRQGKTEPVKFGPVLATFLGFDGQDDEKFQAVADAHGYASRQRAEQIVKEAISMLREVAARNGITAEQAIAAVQALAASRRTDLGMTEDQQEIAKLTGATEQAVESPYQGTMDFKDAESQGMLSRGLRAQTDSGATQVGEGSDETKSGAPGKGTVADLKVEQELDAATTVETAPGETRIKANKEKGEQYLTDNEIKAKRAAEALAKKDAKGGTLAVPEERGQQGKVKYKHNEFEYASAKEDYNDVLNEWIKNGEEVTQWDALPQEYKDRITQAWKDATNPNVNRQLRGRVDLEALTAEYKRLEEDYINAKTKSDKQDAQQGAEAEAESRVQDDNAGVPKQEVAPKSVAAPKGQVQEVTGGIRSKFEDFLGVVIKRFAMEQEGQANLDTMTENDIKPQDVAKEFWANTFFDLPAPAQQLFTQLLKANTGMEPGSTTTVNSATGTSVVAQNWQDVADMIDVGNTAENLEGTERGFVALMYEANKRANAFKAENKAEFTALESSPTKVERKSTEVKTRYPVTYEGKPATLTIFRTVADPSKISGVTIKVEGENLAFVNLGAQGVVTDAKMLENMRDVEIIDTEEPPTKVERKTFTALAKASEKAQALVDKRISQLEGQGVSFEEQQSDPELSSLYEARIAIDESAAKKGYLGAKEIAARVLGGLPQKNTHVTIDSILRETYSLTASPSGVSAMAQYTGRAIDNPDTVSQLTRDISRLILARDYPNADYNAFIGSGGSALPAEGRARLVSEARSKAEALNSEIRAFFAGKEPKPLPPAEAPPKAVQAKATSVARTAKAAKPKSLTKEQKAAAGKVLLIQQMEVAWNDLAGENNLPVWSALNQDQRTRLMEDATPNPKGNAVRAVVAELTGETQEAPAPTVPALELPAIDVDFIDVTDEEVAKATNLLPQLEGALDKTLDENDKQEVTDHFGVEEEFGNATKKLFLKEYAKWLASTNRALHALADIFVKVAKAAVNGILAIAVAVNMTSVQINDAQAAQVPVTTISVTKVLENPKADFKGVTAATDVKVVAEWQLGKNHGLPFIIIDKLSALLFAFNGKGELLGKTPVLLGAVVADDETNPNSTLDMMKASDKITPAGEFDANFTPAEKQQGTNKQYGMTIDLTDQISIHITYLANPKENRPERLATPTADDNRISSGCINADDVFFRSVLEPNFSQASKVIVMPETRSVAEQFPDMTTGKTTTTEMQVEGNQNPASDVSWGSDKYGRPEQRKASRSRARVTMDGSFLEPNDDVMHKDGRVGRVVSTRYRNPKINGLNTITVKFADGTTEGVTPDKLTYLRKASVKFDGRKGTFGNESVNGGLRKITKDDDIALEFDDRVGSVMVTGIDRISGGMSGRASNALKSLTDWADSTNNTLVLMPSASGALKQGDLKAWYSRNGFVSAPDGAMVRTVKKQGTLFSKNTLSDAFKRWFSGSKVVDNNGKPLRVYHGTRKNFDAFSTSGGSFFTSRPNIASAYSAEYNDGSWDVEGSRVLPVYLNIKNPYVTSNADYMVLSPKDIAGLKAKGFDGIKITSNLKEGEWVVFDADQVKSVFNEDATGGDNYSKGAYLNDKKYFYHAVRNDADIDSIVKNGLRAGTNVSSLGGQAFEDEGGTVLVFERSGAQLTGKGYQGDEVVQSSGVKPVAILKDTSVEENVADEEAYNKLGDQYEALEKRAASYAKTLGITVDQFWEKVVRKQTDEMGNLGDQAKAMGREQDKIFRQMDEYERNSEKGNVTEQDVLSKYEKYGLPVQKLTSAPEKDYSKGAPAKGSTVAELTTLLKGYFHAPAFFNRMVEVVQSSKDLPAAVRNDPEFDNTVKAVVHNGKAYIIADKVPANEALSILLHEVGVHLGMKKLLGGNYTRLIAQLKKWESKPGSLEHNLVKKARARVNAAGTSAIDQDHELVAYFVEEAVNAGVNPTDLAKAKGPVAEWIASLMKTVMAALKSMGMKNLDKLTAQDIVDLAYGAAYIQLSSDAQPSTKGNNLFSKGNASTIPKAVEFTNDTVANMLSRVKVTAADLGSKALNAAVFMNDLIKIAEKAGLTAAKGFNDLMGEKDQIRNRGEERISAIMSRASKLKDQSAVEQFLRDSTLAKKYGYGPKSDNGEFARRFTQLSAEGQAVVKDVFQVGEDNYTEMQRLAAVEVNREYNALIARSPKKTAELEKERTKELARMARVMPKLDGPYAPLKRFGDHVVVARSNEYAQAEAAGDRKKMDALIASPNDNNYLVEFYDTAGAADARKTQLVSYFDKVVSSNRQENFHKVDGLPWSGIEKIKSAVEDSPDTKYKAAMNKLLTNLYLKMMAESSARKSELKRRGVVGSGDMFRAFAANGRSNAHFIASMAKNPEIGRKIADMRQESKALREGGNVDATRAMNEILARYAQGLEYKETPWVDKALRVSSLWMLLTSPAYYLQNSTQTYMMTLPVLGGRYGGRAFTEINKAYGDVMKHIGNMGAELDVRKLPITKAEQDMLISLRDKGKLDITIASDMGRWASGAADQGVVGRAIDKMYGAAGKVEALNRITTALAAYRLSNGNEQYAGEIIDMTQGNYAATNAPRFFSATGATKLITQFRKYQLIQISLMGRLMYDAFKGASAEEKAFARRSLLWLFAQQGLLTGLKGLPIPAVIYMIAAALGGDDDDDWERNLRKWIGDEDIATLLIRGIPAYMGLDLSGRIGMGNAFSILPYSDIDFSKKGYKEAVFGATGAFIGGMGGQLFDGLEKMGKGNYYKGLEALAPRGLRDAMAGYRMGTEGVTSGKGDLLLSADEITAFDAAMKAVGLPTTRITEFQTSRGDLFELNNHFKERETALKNDYADAAKQRDSDAMSEAREEWKAIQASKGRWLAYLAGRGLGNKDLTKDLQPHPLGTLLKAPAAQMKRERPWQGAAAQRQAQ